MLIDESPINADTDCVTARCRRHSGQRDHYGEQADDGGSIVTWRRQVTDDEYGRAPPIAG
jgi:hypothetical protein